MPQKDEETSAAAGVRPVLQAIARLIATDRRVVVLATDKAAILLSNAPAGRLGLDAQKLTEAFRWSDLCARARRAGSVATSARIDDADLEGELVHLPLGTADGYLLRLAQSDQEAALLRNKARTATLLRVSHDLRTPIQSLIASTDAALEAKGPDRAAAEVRRARIKRAAEISLSHIDNVIKVIRGEMASGELQADEDFNLSNEVRTIVDMVEPIAEARGATVTLAMSPAEDIRAHGPVRFVRALVQNMLDNSVKHGGSRISLSVTADPVTEDQGGAPQLAIRLEVRDEGGGLPRAQKARLLRAVGAADATEADATEAPQTSGDERPSAGLNILAHALAQLGGTIKVSDIAADGTPAASGAKVHGTSLSVRFSLPAPLPSDSSQDPGLPEGNDVSLKGLGILVVEDSPSSRDWLVHCLASAGANVQSVENGHKALAILGRDEAEQDIDLLLTDMTLPQMNGVDLVRNIIDRRAKKALRWNGKIVGLTAHVDDGLRATCMKLGFALVLEKPIRSIGLCKAIHDIARSVPPGEYAAPQGNPAEVSGSDHSQSVPLRQTSVADLIDQLGLEGARGFMMRAHAEAQAAYQDMQENGIRSDTGRMLHAATGACGLTGLTLLEQRLRDLELAVAGPKAGVSKALIALSAALDVTSDSIEALH